MSRYDDVPFKPGEVPPPPDGYHAQLEWLRRLPPKDTTPPPVGRCAQCWYIGPPIMNPTETRCSKCTAKCRHNPGRPCAICFPPVAVADDSSERLSAGTAGTSTPAPAGSATAVSPSAAVPGDPAGAGPFPDKSKPLIPTLARSGTRSEWTHAIGQVERLDSAYRQVRAELAARGVKLPPLDVAYALTFMDWQRGCQGA